MARWRLPLRWWVATLSPLAFLAVALAVAAAVGKLPRGSDFGRYSGLSAIGVVAVAVIVILVTFGEETGWRGFVLPLLQRRYGALAAALLVTPIWALWHLPYFFTVSTYRGFAPVGYVGFVFGLACGSIVLTWLYNGTGGSIFACAVWHGLYNLETGTAAASSTIQAVTSAFVYVQAFLLVGLELRARRRREASILGPRRRRRAATQASYREEHMRKHLQRFGNLFVIGLLRSPLHRLASGSLLLITYRGRRSGRRLTIPVMYAEREGALTIFVGHAERKRWWRNLRGGAEVEVWLRGRRLRGQAEVVEDSGAVETYLDRYPRSRTAFEAADSPTFVRVAALTPTG